MGWTTLAFHEVTKVEVKPVSKLPLYGDSTFKIQHINLHMADGSKHELSIFLTDDGEGASCDK